jgi:hypothetical protein
MNDKPIPAWAWIFAVACGLIPIVALGGGIPVALGLGGAAGCVAVARNPDLALELRVALCILLTMVCWGLFIGLIMFVLSLQPLFNDVAVPLDEEGIPMEEESDE